MLRTLVHETKVEAKKLILYRFQKNQSPLGTDFLCGQLQRVFQCFIIIRHRLAFFL